MAHLWFGRSPVPDRDTPRCRLPMDVSTPWVYGATANTLLRLKSLPANKRGRQRAARLIVIIVAMARAELRQWTAIGCIPLVATATCRALTPKRGTSFGQ